MLKKLRNWIECIFQSKKYYKYRFVNDVPDHLRKTVIYFVANQGYPWEIVMICPCGCAKLIYLNLLKEYSPYWRYDIDHNKKVSLYPSIHRTTGCKSHFFIKEGTVIWC
jgi:hypothetical protein